MPEAKPVPEILVVDDDEGLLVLMAAALREAGFAVTGAGSGAALLEALAKRKPDLLLLDLKLRDMGGQKLLQRLERADVRVPFVVVTGQGDEKVAVDIMRRGALDYVTKDGALLDLLPGVVQRALTAVERERSLAFERQQRERLQREVLEITGQERRRIGEDLHDGLGQQLTAIEILCAGLKEDVAGQPKLTRQVSRIGQLLRESIGQVRSLARGLVPVNDQPEALWVGLVELVERTNALERGECVFECPEMVLVGEPATADHLYRIAQEALNNAVKHSGAGHLVVAFSRDEHGLLVQVTDDGRGFVEGRAGGMGLQVMRHRASVIGGELTVESKPGKGTTIRCRVPVAK